LNAVTELRSLLHY